MLCPFPILKEGHWRVVFQEYINNTAVKAHPWGEWVQAEPIKLIWDKFASHHHNLKCFRDWIKDQRIKGTSLMTKMYDERQKKSEKVRKTEREFAYSRHILIDKDEALQGQIGRQTHRSWQIGKWAGKHSAKHYMLHVTQIDRFINNESRKTGKINSVNKCAVSSSAPAPNGLCLCTSFASVYIMYVCSCACTLI